MSEAPLLEIVLRPPTADPACPTSLVFSGHVVGALPPAHTLRIKGILDGVDVPCQVSPLDAHLLRRFQFRVDFAAMPPGQPGRFVVIAHTGHQIAVARHDVAPEEQPLVGMRGSLDTPANGSSIVGDVLHVLGWCLFDKSSTSHVDVFLNGRSVGRARTYLNRSDVASSSTHRDAPCCGYELRIPLRDVPDDAALDVAIEAVSLDGRRWRSPTHRAHRETDKPIEEQLAYAKLLRERTQYTLARMHVVRERKIAVVTHDLGYGGGQLWLSEMLRQFQQAALFTSEVFAVADGPLRTDLEAADIGVHVAALPGLSTLSAHEDSVRNLATMLSASGAAAVLVNTVGPFQAVIAASVVGLPIVWAIHESFDLDVYCHHVWGHRMDPTVRRQFAEAFSKPRALVFEAAQTADLFERLSSPEQRFVVDYGVDLEEIDRYRAGFHRRHSRATFGWSDDDVVLVVVGLFEGRKAQAMVVAAFEELAEVHPRLRLALVGLHSGSYCDGVTAQVARSRCRDKIHVEPVTADIYRWYGLSDVLVCASDVESLPRSILEAMAFGLPVVSTNVFGVATLLDDGTTGWLTCMADLRALTATLDRVLRLDAAERRTVAVNAREEVQRRCGTQSYGILLAQSLNDLIDDPDAAPTRLHSHQSPAARSLT